LKHVITSFKKRKLKESDAHQYQHNEQSPLIFFTEYKKTTTYDDEDPVPAFGQLQQCGWIKAVNGI
jgi:hypothetical protein